MVRRILVSTLIVMAAAVGSVALADGLSLDGVKCLMNPGKAAKESKSSEWKDGKVFFCCGHCKSKFDGASKEDKAKLASKANAQLVATKQYAQKACPFSGKKLAADTAIKVAGAEVSFCCKNCKAKAKKMEGDKQLNALFGEKAFKMAGFAPVKKGK